MHLTTPKGTSAWQRRTASLPAVTISRLFSLPFLSLFSNTSVGFSSVCPFLDFFKLSFLVDCLLLCSCHFFPLLLALLCFLWHLMLKSKFSELKNWITLTTERNRLPSEDFKYSQNNFCFSLNIHNICYDFFSLPILGFSVPFVCLPVCQQTQTWTWWKMGKGWWTHKIFILLWIL